MARRRFKSADIKFISLCPRGANKLNVVYKDDDAFEIDLLTKGNMDEGEIHAVVYAPELRDTQGDIASAEVIKDMAYRAARDGLKVDIRHDGRALDPSKAFVAESFIIQKNDIRFQGMKNRDGEEVDVTGGWGVVVKVNDEDLREKYRSGQWSGVSMGGRGDLHIEKARAPRSTKQLLNLLAQAMGLSNARASHHVSLSGEVEMDKTELLSTLNTFKTDLLKEVGGLVATTVSKAQDDTLAEAAGVTANDTPELRAAKITVYKSQGKPAATAAAPVTKDDKLKKPVFTGDMNDEAAVRKFEIECQQYEIKKEVDPSNPASVREAQKKLAELAKSTGTTTTAENVDGLSADEVSAGVLKTDSDGVKKAKLEVLKEQRASGQTVAAPASSGSSAFGVQLDKDDAAALKVGQEIAKAAAAQHASPFKLVG